MTAMTASEVSQRRRDGLRRWITQWVIPGLEPGARVLDVGCGAGHGIAALTGAGFHAIGIDVSPPIRDERILVGDMHKLPFGDDEFDAVVSSHSLEHARDPVVAVAEWARVLRPAGRAFVVLPYPDKTRNNPLHVGRFVLGTNVADGAATLLAFLTRHGWRVEKHQFDSFREHEVWLAMVPNAT